MDYWHKAWTCPYFVWDEKLKIGCECGKLTFPDKKSAVDYMNCYCASHGWQKCTIAASTTEYYERTGNNDKEGSRRKS